MEKYLQEFIEYLKSVEDLEMYIFIFLSLFTLWFIRNTVRFYKGEKRKVKHLHRFAKEGETESQHALAERFQKGNAVKKSCSQAAFWYQKAAYSGDKEAKEKMKKFLEKRNKSRNNKRC